MDAEHEAQALESSRDAFVAARGVLKAFDALVLAPALNRRLLADHDEPVFHAGARQALFPWFITLALRTPGQSFDDLLAGIHFRPNRDGKGRGQGVSFRFAPSVRDRLGDELERDGAGWHTAEARTKLAIEHELVHGAPPPTIDGLRRAAQAAGAAARHFAQSFALAHSLERLCDDLRSLDLTVSPDVEGYDGAFDAPGIDSLVSHPCYFVRLMTARRAPQLNQACTRLAAHRRASGKPSPAAPQREAFAHPGVTVNYPSNRKVFTRTFLGDEVFNYLCVLNPKLSSQHHWAEVRKPNGLKTTPIDDVEKVRPRASRAAAAAPAEAPGVLTVRGPVAAAARAGMDFAHGEISRRCSSERADRALALYRDSFGTFRDGARWKDWTDELWRLTANIQPETDDLRAFMKLFRDEFVRVLPLTRGDNR